MNLLGELLCFGNCEYGSRCDASEFEEIISREPLGISHQGVFTTDVDMEFGVGLPNQEYLAWVTGSPSRRVCDFMSRLPNPVCEVIAEIRLDSLLQAFPKNRPQFRTLPGWYQRHGEVNILCRSCLGPKA